MNQLAAMSCQLGSESGWPNTKDTIKDIFRINSVIKVSLTSVQRLALVIAATEGRMFNSSLYLSTGRRGVKLCLVCVRKHLKYCHTRTHSRLSRLWPGSWLSSSCCNHQPTLQWVSSCEMNLSQESIHSTKHDQINTSAIVKTRPTSQTNHGWY